MTSGYIEDEELGRIKVRPNVRARGFTFRFRDGMLVCTCPARCSLAELHTSMDRLRPKLLALLEKGQAKAAKHQFTPDTRIDVEGFHLWFEQKPVNVATAHQMGENIIIHYESAEILAQDSVQAWLSKTLERLARPQAERILFPRLAALAKARGLTYASARISSAKGRWGSCSGRRSINLSLYLLFLPKHLQDYVMQHELTHLVEMNHGPRFWALLDEACGCKAQMLRDEVHRYDTSFV